MRSSRYWLLGFICFLVAVAFFAAGFFAYSFVNYLNPQYQVYFSQDVSRENIINFNQVKSLLMKNYYMDVNEDKILAGAIRGMAEAMEDPYTVYYSPEQMQDFMEKSKGSYVGIGVAVEMDENQILTINTIFSDSPAQEVGLRIGDKIVRVDDEDVTVIKDSTTIVQKIKGKPDTNVTITVYRPEVTDYFTFNITRRVINFIYIESKIINDTIGYLHLKQFDENVAVEFAQHVNQLITSGAKGLIIDLRNNPGGDYTQVVRIADMLLPSGVIVYTEDKNGNRDEKKSDGNALNIPLTILINEYSASASEILSAAVKDFGRGTLVGKTTFGKGLVQSVIPLEGGAGLKVTIARYFSPKGISIHGVGVTPDIEVENDKKYQYYRVEDIPQGEDRQLARAIEEIKKLMAENK